MKKTKLIQSQNIGMHKQQEGEQKVSVISREHGLSQPAFISGLEIYRNTIIRRIRK